MESNGVHPRQLIHLINPRSIPSSRTFLLVRNKIPRPLPTESADLTKTYQSPSPSFRYRFVLSSHDHDISRHVARDRDISRHHHVLCTANAVSFPMPIHSYAFISAYKARRSSPCDFGLDLSGAVPNPWFSKKLPTWSGVDAGVLGHCRRFDQNLTFPSL